MINDGKSEENELKKKNYMEFIFHSYIAITS
jgi:hypothetical protein